MLRNSMPLQERKEGGVTFNLPEGSSTPSSSPKGSPKLARIFKGKRVSSKEEIRELVDEEDKFFVQLAESIILSNNKDYQRYFVITYRKHGTPSQLYKIWQRLLLSPENLERASEFLLTWLDHGCENDFPAKRITEVLDLIQKEKVIQSSELKLMLFKLNTKRAAGITNKTVPLKSKSLRSLTDGVGDILSADDQDLAKALTSQEFDMFAKILPSDLMDKIGWSCGGVKSSKPISRLIARLNKISTWVATEIVSRTDKKHQLAVLEKFIRVARKCERLNNFNTLMEIIAGLNNVAVHRLKGLWAQLSPKYTKIFEDLEKMMTAANNYRNYNQELNSRKLPALPYFGVFLRDFAVSDEANPIRNEDGTLNFELMKIFGQRIDVIRKYQATPYKFEYSKSTALLISSMYCIEDEELLYKLSLKSEPANDKEQVHSSPLRSKKEYLEETDNNSPSKQEKRKSGPFNFTGRFGRFRASSLLIRSPGQN